MVRFSFFASLFSILFLFPTHSAKGAPIWSDSFESGNFANWSEAGANWTIVTSLLSAHSGLRGADIKGDTALGGGALLVNLATSGTPNVEVGYWYKVRDTLDSADWVAVEWSANNTDWQTLALYSGVPAGDWQYANFALPSEAGDNPDFSLRFVANLSSATDRMNIDDVTISSIPVPEPSFALSTSAFVGLALMRRRR